MDVNAFSNACNFKISKPGDWDRWPWQVANAVRSIEQLNAALASFTTHRARSSELLNQISADLFPVKITPHMLFALHRGLEGGLTNAWNAFCAAFLPSELEAARLDVQDNNVDGIGEELPEASPAKSITNFYENRVLFRVTKMCPAHCRYCFRRRMVTDAAEAWDENAIRAGLDYIAKTPTVHEVILSGGDPLILGDSRLAFLCESLRRLPHIRRIRIDTKALTMLPQRITEDLVQIFRKHQPVYIVGHFTHLFELESGTREACARLVNAGIPVLAHTPLLHRVNDDEDQLVALMETLVDCRVRPYYLIHFIPTKWTEHFRVSIQRGLELLETIHRHCGGLAWPTYIVYLPGAAGKIPVSPQYLVKRIDGGYVFRSLRGGEVIYEEFAKPELAMPRKN